MYRETVATKITSGSVPDVHVQLFWKYSSAADSDYVLVNDSVLANNSASFALTGANPSKTVSALDKFMDNGGTPTEVVYRFFEVSGSGTGWEKVDTSTDAINGYKLVNDSFTSSAGTFSSTLQNQLQTKDITVTKNWLEGSKPLTSGQPAIAIALQVKKSNVASWPATPTVAATYTVTNSGSATVLQTVNGSSGLPATPACSTITTSNSGATWAFTVNGLPVADTDGVSYDYRFVETTIGGVSVTNDLDIPSGTATIDGKEWTVTYTGSSNETISNQKPPSAILLEVYKVIDGTFVHNGTSITSSGTGLSGAVFTLAKTDAPTGSWTLTTPDGSSSTALEVVSIKNTIYTVPAAGSVNISSGLPDGTYILTETRAPAGYALHSGSISFVVENGETNLAAISSDASGRCANTPYTTLDSETGLTVYHFVIENTAGTELPSTGQAFGLSRMGFASLGTVLLTAFVALYMYKKKQRYYADLSEDDFIDR